MRLKITLIFVLGLLLLMSLQPTVAVELPPDGSVAYIQTSGPNAGLNIGDFYTNVAGENGTHQVLIYVPCGWDPALPLTFSVFDPETAAPNPVVPPFAEDEIRDAPDTVTFTLTSPGGVQIANAVFANNTSNALWVEIATITTQTPGYGCGPYALETSVSDNDDNAWRLRVGHDPQCTVTPGTCTGISGATSALMGNADFTDDPDGDVGTGDELYVGFTRLSKQHQAPGCEQYFLYVDGATNPITLNNFDFDDFDGTNPDVSITYFPPPGSTHGAQVIGTESGRTSWNNAPDNGANMAQPPRVGDTFAINPQDIGWWEVDVCMDANNQYIFEGLQDEPVFFDQPPFPNMVVGKDNGVTTVSSAGQQVTYTITYANTNPVGPPTNGGAALNVTIVDTLPAGATFVSCSNGCTSAGNTVTWNIGVVAAPPNVGNNGSVTLTVNLPAAAAGSTHTNNVSLDYTDVLGLDYPPETAQDIDNVVAGPPSTPVPPAPAPGSNSGGGNSSGLSTSEGLSIGKRVDSPFAGPGDTLTYTVVLSNTGSSNADGRVTDTLPDGLLPISATSSAGQAVISGNTVTVTGATLAPGASVTITITAQIDPAMPVPFTMVNRACITDTATCADATTLSVTALPQTGESPWSSIRTLMLSMVIGLSVSMVSAVLLLRQRRPQQD